MPLHLHFAPHADLLLRVLRDDLSKEWRKDPFNSPLVIVPNPAVKRWLTLQLARGENEKLAKGQIGKGGAVLGLHIDTLERVVWDWFRTGLQAAGVCADPKRLDVEGLRLALLQQLRVENLGEDLFAPVRRYIGENDVQKRMQLAGYLAMLFLEYEFNRPSVWNPEGKWALHGLDQSWLQGKSYDFQRQLSQGVREQELWQAELYRRAVASLPADCKSLPHWHRLWCENGLSVPGGPVHVFLVSKISHWHRNLLVDLSQHQPRTTTPSQPVDMRLYLPNPCAEFWEDVDTWGKRPRRVRWNSEQATQSGPNSAAGFGVRRPEEYQLQQFAPDHFARDPRLLELWGHSARENIALWCPAAQWDFEYHHPAWIESEDIADANLSLLRALQKALLRREATLQPCTIDASLQIIDAPSAGREVEELRMQILDALADPANSGVHRLEDVVVYLCDVELYLPHIYKVFGAYHRTDARAMPFHILGAPGSDSLYAQAVECLLAILEGRFDRALVFALLRNPVWQASHGAEPAQVAVWERWAAATGMVRGFDAAHRAQMGDLGAAASDVHSFGLGLARLLVGGLADGAVDLGLDVPVPGYRDFDTGDSDSLEGFLAAIEGLYTTSTQLLSQKESGLGEQLQKVWEWVDLWLPILPQQREWKPVEEARCRQAFSTALQSQIALAIETGVPAGTRDEWLALVRACLPTELAPGSKAWVGGITFAPLRMGMVLPHSMVAVLGLGAKQFPGVTDPSALDLLAAARKVGDSHPVRDNQHAFLETIHAAGHRLLLSYCGRDLQKQEQLQPSSVLMELLDNLPQHLTASKIPIGSFESTNRTWDARDILLREVSVNPRAQYRFASAALAHNTQTTQNASYIQAIQTISPVSISDRLSFLQNPLYHHVQRVLGLRLEEELDTLTVTSEPLGLDALAKATLQNELWLAILQHAFAANGPQFDLSVLENFVQQQVATLQLRAKASGISPMPPFDQVEWQSLLAWGLQRLQSLPLLQQLFPHHVLSNVPSFGWVLQPANQSGIPRIAIVSLKRDGNATDDFKLWNLCVEWFLAKGNASSSLQLLGLQLNRKQEEAEKQFSALAIDVDTGDERTQVLWQNMRAWRDQCDAQILAGHSEHLPLAVVHLAIQKVQKDLPEVVDPFSHLDLEYMQELLDDGKYVVYDQAWPLVEARLPQSRELVIDLARQRYAPFIMGWVHGGWQ